MVVQSSDEEVVLLDEIRVNTKKRLGSRKEETYQLYSIQKYNSAILRLRDCDSKQLVDSVYNNTAGGGHFPPKFPAVTDWFLARTNIVLFTAGTTPMAEQFVR
jgi:hypothetical protein